MSNVEQQGRHAPAAGGLEAVAEIEAIFRRHLQANDYAKDLIKRIALDVVPVARKALSAALASPAATLVSHETAIGETQAALCSTDGTEAPDATSGPTYVVNCCNCGRIIDTREDSEGGDQWGHELSDDRWVCSPECLDAVTDPVAVPAATSAETQGGDGVREAKQHAVELEQCSLFVDSPPLKKAMTDAAKFLRTAALAPSTSAAPRGEPVAWMRRWAYDGIDVMAMKKEDRPRGWGMHATALGKLFDDDVALYASPPAPAVESAQVKEGPQLSERDQQIVREWLLATHSHRGGSRLGRLIAQRIADDLEADGVTEADIDRLFPRASLELATDAEG